MEPITVAGAFGSIVSLLGLWKSEVAEGKAKDLGEYLEWLRRKEHNQLAELIEGNSELSTSLRVLVEDQHGQVMGELRKLEQVMVDVARNLAEFQPLADAMVVTSGLSEQAPSILHQMNEGDAGKFLESHPRRSAYAVFNQHSRNTSPQAVVRVRLLAFNTIRSMPIVWI